MKLLSKQQSGFLKLVSENEIHHSSLNDEERKMYQHLKKLGFISRKTIQRVDYQGKPKPDDPVQEFPIVLTELGKQYLENESAELFKLDSLRQEVSVLRQMAADAQASAEESSVIAKRANTVSIVAVFIALTAVVIQLLEYFRK